MRNAFEIPRQNETGCNNAVHNPRAGGDTQTLAVKNLNGLIAPGSPMTASTEAMLDDLRRSLRSLRSLTDSLQTQPDSLITGRNPKPYSRETLGAPAK